MYDAAHLTENLSGRRCGDPDTIVTFNQYGFISDVEPVEVLTHIREGLMVNTVVTCEADEVIIGTYINDRTGTIDEEGTFTILDGSASTTEVANTACKQHSDVVSYVCCESDN